MINTITKWKIAGTALLALLQSGCSVMPSPQKVENYSLPVGTQTTHCSVLKFDSSLQVEKPYANQFLNSSRIAVRTEDNILAVYKGARWNDTAPVILRDRLIQAFQRNECLRTVSSGELNLNSDVKLDGELYAFQGEYQATNKNVRIHYFAYLIDSRTQQVIASQGFNILEPINGSGMNGAIAAFGKAADRLSDELTYWINEQKL